MRTVAKCFPLWAIRAGVSVLAVLAASSVFAAQFFVAGNDPKASDQNPGTPAAPWKTISRAGGAKELKPGDTVLIGSGVYRENVDINVSGEPGRPIIFAAAPLARVVLKGSELVRGPWTRLADVKGLKEPYPHAFRRVWRTRLGNEFFTDPRNPGCYADKSQRWVSQVFLEDDSPLQMIGPDGVYDRGAYKKQEEQCDNLMIVGKGRDDMIHQSFFFDPKEQMLYLNIGGNPHWFSIEVGVRGSVLTASKVHDVVIRGLEVRHNRQPAGQGAMAGIGECQRVVVEDCRFYLADFNGLGLGGCKDCVVRRCDLSHNGCTGLALYRTEDCTVEDCTLLGNDYRRFSGDWGVAAGMKNIPGNKRTTIRRCEVAYNIEAQGIWFDTENSDIRILDNVVHDNADCGIYFEVNFNPGGAVIAGNLVYGNHGRGIYVAGSQNAWVVHNTVAENNVGGIVGMTRGGDTLKNCRVLNNLLIRNYISAADITRGADLVLGLESDIKKRAELGQVADYNVYAANSWTPFMRANWNDSLTLPQWQQLFGQDKHSRQMTVDYRRFGASFKLLTQEGLDVAGPLPDEVKRIWQPSNPRRVGAPRTQWPGN
jgi:parallel beta-helix repeat protein